MTNVLTTATADTLRPLQAARAYKAGEGGKETKGRASRGDDSRGRLQRLKLDAALASLGPAEHAALVKLPARRPWQVGLISQRSQEYRLFACLQVVEDGLNGHRPPPPVEAAASPRATAPGGSSRRMTGN